LVAGEKLSRLGGMAIRVRIDKKALVAYRATNETLAR
jgi:hypothetical protein